MQLSSMHAMRSASTDIASDDDLGIMVSPRDDNMTLGFSVRPASMVSDQQLDACAQLFSRHYGAWGPGAPLARQGRNVELSARLLKQEFLFNKNCCLCLATLSDGTVVGHAFATRFAYHGGSVSWITQLVVHRDHRSRGVASKLCRMAWDVNTVVGCGIVSSHPYAIRALERATWRRCKPGLLDHASHLISASGIPYLQGRNVYCEPANSMCKVDTGFFVDHTDVSQLFPLQPARLGLTPLEDGHEFVALVWTRQPSLPPSKSLSSDDERRAKKIEFAKYCSILLYIMIMSNSTRLRSRCATVKWSPYGRLTAISRSTTFAFPLSYLQIALVAAT